MLRTVVIPAGRNEADAVPDDTDDPADAVEGSV